MKFERATAHTAYDSGGLEVDIPRRRDEWASVFVEHGLSRRLTLQAKGGYTTGRDSFVDYRGQGPLELGLRWAAYVDRRTAVSLYLGGVDAGEGRNAGYAAPGAGSYDLEARLLAGRSGLVWRRPVFAEVQVARLQRQGLPDELRFDSTLGLEPANGWLLLVQTYQGRAQAVGVDPRWLKGEASVVRRLGPWRVQAGWRQTLGGRATPVERGPVLGVWRSF